MNSIGGYFELEIRRGLEEHYHPNAHYLNSGRNCLELIVTEIIPSKIYMPKYSCDVLNEALDSRGIDIEYYSLDKDLKPDLEIDFRLKDKELFLYTNYFGCFYHNVTELSGRITDNLIIDNAQSFYDKPLSNLATFYSPRKFFGVPDGGILYFKLQKEYNFNKDVSINRISHLIKRIDLSAEAGFPDYLENDISISGKGIMRMSNLTARLLEGIDFEFVEKRRKANFGILHEFLHTRNEITNFSSAMRAPMCYPLLIDSGALLKDFLIRNKVYVPTYWPKLMNEDELNEFEINLCENLVCLPLDQRYGENEMMYLINLINDFGKRY